MWRPVIEKVVSYTEICSSITLIDLVKINDLLDMRIDLEQEAYERKKHDS